MTKTTLFIAALLMTVSGFAQNYVDIARISYASTPVNDFEGAPGGSHIGDWALQLNIPVPLNDKLVLLPGFSGQGTRLRLKPGAADPTTLYSLAIELGLNHRMSGQWAATYMIIPKVASDLNESLGRGFQLALLSLFTKTRSESLGFSFGLYANTEAYGLQLVPLAGLYYLAPSRRFEVNLLLPVRAELQYALNTTTSLGMNFDGLGTSYALNNSGFSDAYVNKTSNELFAYLQYRLGPSLLLRMKTGYAFFRAYKVYDEDDKISLSLASLYFGDRRNVLNPGIQDGVIFKLEAVYRLRF